MSRAVLVLALAALAAGCGASAGTSSSAGGASATVVPATATATAADAPQPTATPVAAVLPGEHWLAFQSDAGGGTYGIRLVRLDGTGLHALAPDVPGQYQLHPDWSPDGRRLVFAEVGFVATDLWLIDADGGNAKHIVDCTTGCSLADEPSFSPDGTMIAFHRQATVDGRFVSTLELYDLASGTTRVVLNAADDRVFFAPRWAPDGHRIVVENVRRKPGGTADDIVAGQLAIVDTSAAHAKAQPITGPDYWPGNPEWSPDGATIVFFRPEEGGNFDGPTDLWTIHPDGSGVARLTHMAKDGGQAIHPAWAPDGKRIVFVSSPKDSGRVDIVTIAADGSDQQPVAAGGDIQGLHPRLRPTP